MPRTEIDTTLYRSNGSVAAGATARLRQRGLATDIEVYAAATGGSPVSQPITADSEGRIAGFLETDDNPFGLHVDIVYVVDGVTYTEPVNLPPNAFTWTAVTFANGWGNFGSGYSTAAYGKTAEGMVVLHGLVSAGTVGATMFTLPADFRPAQACRFATIANAAIGRVDITTGGAVSLATGGSNAYVALGHIIFPVKA